MAENACRDGDGAIGSGGMNRNGHPCVGRAAELHEVLSASKHMMAQWEAHTNGHMDASVI